MLPNTWKQWYSETPRTALYYQGIPLQRMRMLFLAVFCLFGIIGLFNDLLNLGKVPYVIVLLNTVVSGCVALVYVLIATRYHHYWFFVVSILQVPFWIGFSFFVNFLYTHFHLHDVLSAQGIRVVAIAILALVIMSYSLFIGFITRQGADAYRVRTELALAHGIQQTLVPPITVRAARFEIYGISKPSEKVGGDLVDALCLPNGDAIAYIADIAGHGLQAGILMGMLKTAVRTALLEAGELDAQQTLPRLLDRLNSVLPVVKEAHMYATFTGFRLGVDGSVHYALAASPPILHWHASGRTLSQVEEEQFPLGLLPVPAFDGQRMETAPGDLLVVATDGILEVSDRSGEELGVERLKAVIAANTQTPLADLAVKILAVAQVFGKQLDDQTILIVRCL
ncbi:MAG TPA: PP2C family protein-serine/threonine phosphatase [Silvibacterium sp.]|nr:PP2C family protein-serine/threonine phosphatase [Silvibacterium sp.]